MMLWTVSGECRRVGKTRVCQDLVAILPDSVYVKIGHNPRQAHKPHNYFTTVDAFAEFADALPDSCGHCVVESGRMVREGRGDIRVFIQAAPGAPNAREDADQLRRNANIVIAPGGTVGEWASVLRTEIEDAELVRQVCGVFEGQQRFLAG